MKKIRNPFSAGRWVVGDSFFGRMELIDRINHSSELCDWVIGQRRVGKTSFLRQMEWLSNQPGTNRFGLFWDIQGSFNADGLTESLLDAIEDSQDEYPEIWEQISFTTEPNPTSHGILKQLGRSLAAKGLKFVILIDEAEEFMAIGKNDPSQLSKLRKIFQNTRQLHTIICSTPKLEHFHKTILVETSPLLHGFHSRYLGTFSLQETTALLREGDISQKIIEAIHENTGGNPFETQLLAKHYFEQNDFEKVCTEIELNPSLIQVLEVNFELLSADEQNLVKDIYCGKNQSNSFHNTNEQAALNKLEMLGYLKHTPSKTYQLSSNFMCRWLKSRFDTLQTFHSQNQTDPIADSSSYSLLLQNIIRIYKFFLETANSKQTPNHLEPSLFRISQLDNSIYPNLETVELIPLETDKDPWEIAVSLTYQFIFDLKIPNETWSLYRFKEMASGDLSHYSETDFLDLMLLIGEEASLET